MPNFMIPEAEGLLFDFRPIFAHLLKPKNSRVIPFNFLRNFHFFKKKFHDKFYQCRINIIFLYF